jgi:glyoxylase-like metal-dependent hydrolase (beta-lactamase superfamily II)
MTQGVLEKPTFPEPDVYEIYQMTYGSDPRRRVHNNFAFLDMHDGPMPLDFNVWIIRNAHRTVLVDTGFGERASRERGRPLDIDPVEGLARIGVDPETIDDIVITHLHFDHAGNLGRFGKARLHIQDDEVRFATGRCMCDAFLRRPFDVEDVVALVRCTYADRVVFHDGDVELFPGISLIKCPGHSSAIQAVQVSTPRGVVVLGSDTSHYYSNILNNKPFNLTIDAAATLQSYRRLMAIAGTPDRFIPGHDPKVRRLYPSVNVNGIDLALLHRPPVSCDMADLLRTDNF